MISSETSRKGGAFLHDIISAHPHIIKTFEVGCAYGLSSLFISEGLKGRDGTQHTIIDPFQSTDWKSCGVHALNRAGFSNFRLIEKKSEFALPELVAEAEGTYDFAFIDGWHTLDHVMVDCFYASRLLKPGGFLVLDDTNAAPIAKVAQYFQSYPCYDFYAALTEFPDKPLLNLACRTMSLLPVSHNMRHGMSKNWQRLIRKPNIIALRKMAEDERKWYWYKPL